MMSDTATGPPTNALHGTETHRPANEVVEDVTDVDGDLGHGVERVALVEGDGTPRIKARAYQLEMLEESLKRNIIVAADTGSGKTHIAVIRIVHELERISEGRFIWFLAPTVSLCTQQFEVLETQITSVQIKCLKGDDGVDRWTSKEDWDTVLKNVKVVVSTFQILLDALDHGFVSMDSLALIVFDEAHNCVGKHPGAKIMNDFYNPRKTQGLHVPYILGLTASPVMKSNPQSLVQIESTLDAVARTPTKHRQELREAVNLPTLSEISYQSLPSEADLAGCTKTIASLGEVYRNLNINEDPYVVRLVEDSQRVKSQQLLQKVRMNQKTWSRDQIRSLYTTALRICREMGAYGADWYIASVVSKFIKMADERHTYLGIWDVSSAEKRYVANALRQVELPSSLSKTPATVTVSPKVTKMIEAICQDSKEFRGIVFVQTRAEVAVLFHLLSIHHSTRDQFRIGTMVGTSAHAYRAKNVGELIDVSAQKHTLSLFKDGVINLVIATSVLEEGIDIPACNVVVCFQKPANLKSFVQRRGRARKNFSKLILLLDPAEDKVKDWQQLEADMKRLYEDDMRALNELLSVEDAEEHDGRQFRVESTGALLDLDNAVTHLYHFCATLPAKDYVDLRPEFICSSAGPSLMSCTVNLPLSVNENIRTHHSRTSWKSEKNAMKDAAFEAYISLYHAGLVNDNLLPLLRHDAVVDELLRSEVEKRAAIMVVNEQLNPWIDVAKSYHDGVNLYKAIVTVGDIQCGVYLPVAIPPVAPFKVYWDNKTEFLVELNPKDVHFDKLSAQRIAQDTTALLDIAFGHRFRVESKPLAVQFSMENDMPLEGFKDPHQITDPAQLKRHESVIRAQFENNVPYQFVEWLTSKPPIEMVQKPYQNYSDAPDIPYLSLLRLPRRTDFLHSIPLSNITPSSKPYSEVLPITSCTVDSTPFPIVQFGRFIPSIIRRFELSLLAHILSTTILKDVGINDISLVVTALCASSAREASNYQRLEFLGDCVLKTCTSVQLVSEYPLWHEGYLSAKKDRLVSNSRLSRAAVETGLDRFIITNEFTGAKWRPPYIDDFLADTEMTAQRSMSSKVLADVVEALIGVAMIDGGIPKALKCLQVFLPELEWQALETRRISLYQRIPEAELPPTLQLLENLIGYSFNKKALLIEAMTHASSISGSQSLDRLEFLGDSILDNIVVKAIYAHRPELSAFQMHLLRTALVNADFLAFVSMDWAVEQEKSDLVEIGSGTGKIQAEFEAVTSTVSLPLNRFLRHTSPEVGQIQAATATRHSQLRDQINSAIQHSTHYPWALLSKLQAQKFYSDMVESLLGAIWMDSGSLETCTGVVERMGVLTYLRRILKDGVQVWHPKEQLGVLADTETVKYVIGDRETEGDVAGHEGREYWCKIFVGDREVVEIGGGVGKEEIKTKAAEEAVRLLEAKKAIANIGRPELVKLYGY